MLSEFEDQHEIEAACHRGGGYTASLFLDQNFPPNLKSLIGCSMVEKATEDPGCHNLPVAFKEVEWLRPRQFAQAEGSFIMWAMQNPRPQMDVEASPHMPLALLVKHLSGLTGAEARDLFVHDAKSEAGVYELSIPVAGRNGLERKRVIIDDHIPCVDGVPIIARNSHSREVWVPL